MRIGYIVQQFYPTAYGSGIHAFELALELTKLGHEIHIITKGEPHQQNFEVFKGIYIHRALKYIKTPYYFPFNSILLWKSGFRIIQKLDLDIILGHGFESSLFFSLKKDKPMIYKAVGTIGLQKNRSNMDWRDVFGKISFPILGQLEKTAIRNADLAIAISDTVKRELIEVLHTPENKIHRIYNGVNIRRFHPSVEYSELENKLSLNGKNIILFVGRLSPIKGPQLLIRAIPKIIKRFPDAFFLFLGDGPLFSYLKYMANQLQVSKYIMFLGFVSNDLLPKYFAMADICVIPSLYEPFGLVALESLASGTATITSVEGGLAEIHKSFSEFLTINPLTPEILATQINILLSNPEKFKHLKQKGRQIISKFFTWERCARLTSQVLTKIREKKEKS